MVEDEGEGEDRTSKEEGEVAVRMKERREWLRRKGKERRGEEQGEGRCCVCQEERHYGTVCALQMHSFYQLINYLVN